MVDLVTDASVDADRERASVYYVVFQLGGEGYALEVMRVQEVLDMQSIDRSARRTEVPSGSDQPPRPCRAGLRFADAIRSVQGNQAEPGALRA